jgi:hypothetical protein
MYINIHNPVYLISPTMDCSDDDADEACEYEIIVEEAPQTPDDSITDEDTI